MGSRLVFLCLVALVVICSANFRRRSAKRPTSRKDACTESCFSASSDCYTWSGKDSCFTCSVTKSGERHAFWHPTLRCPTALCLLVKQEFDSTALDPEKAQSFCNGVDYGTLRKQLPKPIDMDDIAPHHPLEKDLQPKLLARPRVEPSPQVPELLDDVSLDETPVHHRYEKDLSASLKVSARPRSRQPVPIPELDFETGTGKIDLQGICDFKPNVDIFVDEEHCLDSLKQIVSLVSSHVKGLDVEVSKTLQMCLHGYTLASADTLGRGHLLKYWDAPDRCTPNTEEEPETISGAQLAHSRMCVLMDALSGLSELFGGNIHFVPHFDAEYMRAIVKFSQDTCDS